MKTNQIKNNYIFKINTAFITFCFVFLFLSFNIIKAQGGGVEFTDDVVLDLDGFNVNFYIGKDSEVSLLEIGENTLNANGVPVGGFFHLKTDEHTALKLSSNEESSDFSISSKGLTSSGYFLEWEIKTEGKIGYIIGINDLEKDYTIRRNEEEIDGSPFSPVGNEIIFDAAGVGIYKTYDPCQQHNFSGYAWSSNIGWISFSCVDEFGIGNGSDYGVDYDKDGYLSGYAWSSNIGWVGFNEESVSGCPGGGNCRPRIEDGIEKDDLIGWARVCSVFESGCSGSLKDNDYRGGFNGWIKLHDIKIDKDGNVDENHKWAWGGGGDSIESAVIGWIDMSGVSVDDLFLYNPEMKVSINNNISYCNINFKNHPYLRFEWEYLEPDEDYKQTSYQVEVEDSNNNRVYPKDGQEKLKQGNSNAYFIHEDDNGDGYLDYGKSYRARVKTWTEDTYSDWSEWSEFYDMPDHHYPMVDFSWEPDEINAEEEIEFKDETEIFGGLGYLKNRLWTFGDDANPQNSSEETIIVIFEKEGDRNISLEVEDQSGYKCPKTEEIRVQYPIPDWKEVSPF